MVRQCAACLGWCNDFSASQFSKGYHIRRCVHCIEAGRYPHSNNPELIDASRQRATDRGADYHNPDEKKFLQDLKAQIDNAKDGVELEELCRQVPFATWWRLGTNMEKALRVLSQYPGDFEIIAADHKGETRDPGRIREAIHKIYNHEGQKEVFKLEDQIRTDAETFKWVHDNPLQGLEFDVWHKGWTPTEEAQKVADEAQAKAWAEWDKWYEGWHYFPGQGWKEVDPEFLKHPERVAAEKKGADLPISELTDALMN